MSESCKPLASIGVTLREGCTPYQAKASPEEVEKIRRENPGYLRIRQVAEMTLLSRATIYRLMRLGMFPLCYRLSLNTVAWKLADVQLWLNDREINQAA